MGYGSYSHDAHRDILSSRAGHPAQEVFRQRECHPLMNPKGVRVRESRDSATHPNSIGVVFALDVTGSMRDIPRLLAQQELPRFMKVMESCGVADPQLLFMAIGDATSDRAPLQVGQFESEAHLMDQWLTWSFLEGGGGRGQQESYELGLYFLAEHIEMDCLVKRNKRGFLFMTGDENPYPSLSKHIADTVTGDRLDEDLTTEEIVAELSKSFHPFFLIPDLGRSAVCERRWRDLLGDHVIVMDQASDVCFVAGGAMALTENLASNIDELPKLLNAAGIEERRIRPVINALTPYAESLGKSRSSKAGFFEKLWNR